MAETRLSRHDFEIYQNHAVTTMLKRFKLRVCNECVVSVRGMCRVCAHASHTGSVYIEHTEVYSTVYMHVHWISAMHDGTHSLCECACSECTSGIEVA